MNIEVNVTKPIKLEAITGLTDVFLSIYNSSQVAVVDSVNMIEVLTGLYQANFTPTIIGNYTGKVTCNSLGRIEFFDIEVTLVIAKEATILQTESDIIAEINANEVKIDTIKNKVDTLDNTDLTDIEAGLEVINQGVKKASLLIPHNTDL